MSEIRFPYLSPYTNSVSQEHDHSGSHQHGMEASNGETCSLVFTDFIPFASAWGGKAMWLNLKSNKANVKGGLDAQV